MCFLLVKLSLSLSVVISKTSVDHVIRGLAQGPPNAH
jgi:hypothetical protein